MLSHTVRSYTQLWIYTQKPAARCSLNYPAVINLWLMVPSLMVAMIGSYWLCNFSTAPFGRVGKLIWCNTEAQLHVNLYYGRCALAMISHFQCIHMSADVCRADINVYGFLKITFAEQTVSRSSTRRTYFLHISGSWPVFVQHHQNSLILIYFTNGT